MGLSWHHVKGIITARNRGVSFQHTLTLGRQELFTSAADVCQLLCSARFPYSVPEALRSQPKYGEPLYATLGAERVDSMDCASYEGATIIHDLNTPVPAELKNKFDVVDDGGTLEHVFNYPTALKNAMNMVKPGGALLLFTPANNYMGHGFYTFSPELFFEALGEKNGFRVERMVLYEVFPRSRWYE